MTVNAGPSLALALVLLLGLAVAASAVGRLGLGKAQVVAGVRALIQLAAVSAIIVAAVQSLLGSFAFVVLMFVIALVTTSKRVGIRSARPWVALPLMAGTLPVLLIVFATGAAPLNGIAVVSLAGIVIGNMMTAHTLTGRRCFAQLRDNVGIYEAALALGYVRHQAIGMVIEPVLTEGLVPNLDQTKTVGLVTLPGAFIGVLLGGGSPVQAGAAQLLVLIGIMAGQAITVITAAALVRRVRLLPDDLHQTLHA